MLCLPTVHLKAFIMADNYVCDVCLFECTSHENMQDHIRAVHIAVKTFECDQCDHFLLTEKRLNIHMRMVHSKKEKICKLCDYETMSSSGLRRHARALHEGKNELKYGCDLCDNQALDKSWSWTIFLVFIYILRFGTGVTSGRQERQIQRCEGGREVHGRITTFGDLNHDFPIKNR